MKRFDDLLPETILDSVSNQGFRPTGALFPLNSYENRVYEIAIDEAEPIVAKFYRPDRWGIETIADEHRFLERMAAAEVPVVQSLVLREPVAESPYLGQVGEIYYAIFPKFRGREHAETTNDDRRWLGRTLGRLHNIGAHFPAEHRVRLDPKAMGAESLNYIVAQPYIPEESKAGLEAYLHQALELSYPYFTPNLEMIALHGDCHPGNILWNVDGPHLLDFDDMIVAPPVQDVWMLLNGTEAEKREQLKIFCEGYALFRDFDQSTLRLTEPLRTLRMIRHTAWIGQRYQEPAFQRAFPYFTQHRYWAEFLLSIKEQIGHLQELQWQ